MGIKTFLKRFVAAYGDAASEQLSKDPRPPVDLSNSTSEQIDSINVDPITSDFNTLPAGYNDYAGLDEPT